MIRRRREGGGWSLRIRQLAVDGLNESTPVIGSVRHSLTTTIFPRMPRVQAIFRDGSESFGLSMGNSRNSGNKDPYCAIILRYSH